MMTGVGAMTTAELREANGLIAEVVGDIRLRKGPEDDVARFQRLYEKALRAVLDGRIGAVESLNFERELRTVLAEAERILGQELAAELEPATRRYLERAFKAAVLGLAGHLDQLSAAPRADVVSLIELVDHIEDGKRRLDPGAMAAPWDGRGSRRLSFLEVNPNGQWLWLDDALNCGFSDTVVGWLLGERP